MIRLAGQSSFIWKTTEQVYPFEQGPAGEPVYAIMLSLNPIPNNSGYFTVGSVPGLTSQHKIRSITGQAYQIAGNNDSWFFPADTFVAPLAVRFNNSAVELYTTGNYSAYRAEIKILYLK